MSKGKAGSSPATAAGKTELARAVQEAQDLATRVAAGDPQALESVSWNHPRFRSLSGDALRREPFVLADAEHVVAQLHYFEDGRAARHHAASGAPRTTPSSARISSA